MANKDAGLAVVLSVIMPGLGQIYNEQFLKGAVVFILALIAALLIVAGIGLILFPIVWVYSAWDAYSVASGGEDAGWP